MTTQPMTFDETPALAELRQRVRGLIESELPPDFRGAFADDEESQAIAMAFCKRLAEERLLTFSWPPEHGGAGGSIWEQTALREEFWAHHEPRGAQYMGVNWVGPAIMHFGTPEQKRRHLPAIAAGDEVWCQGFSEPDAGSDLASLQLRATRSADGTYRATGQKIWTSYARLATWCFLTTRTATGERKQHGISVFLVPMDREGISVRPIDSIMGPHHLNEVFFDDVVLHPDELLGELHRGWDVIGLVLRFERVGIARYARSDKILSDLWPLIQEADGPASPELRTEHARALVQARIAKLLSYRTLASGETPGTPAQPGISRIASTLLDQRVAEIAMEALGAEAVNDDDEAPLGGRVEDAWRYARASTIASGTTEIQRLLAARSMTRGS